VPRVTVMPNGVTASCPRFGTPEETTKRGECHGWTIQATRRLRRFFFTVDGQALDGQGYALTLTVRDMPGSAAEWTAAHRAFLMRMRRAGMIRGQWLTEWQRRGVPHLHGAVYFPEGGGDFQQLVADHWLEVAARWSPRREAQAIQGIWGFPGWLQYQAKHSSRGVRHYQRANVPPAWREGTGRLWGYVGEWPQKEVQLDVDDGSFHRFRRLMRSWLIAKARARGDHKRVSWLRRMLADPQRTRSTVRAVGEFCPQSVAGQLLVAAVGSHGSAWKSRKPTRDSGLVCQTRSGSPEPEPPKAQA
jgi:hypothetical protein